MISDPLKARLKAGGIHLSICALIALLALGVIFGVWYPGALAPIQGVSGLVPILIGADVAIGPLLTTVIYDPRKKSLPFDLAVIAALQTMALLYGLHTIFEGRPAYVVYLVGRFDVVRPADVDADSLRRAQERGGPGLPWWGPRMVASKLHAAGDVRERVLSAAMSGGPGLEQLPEWFVPLTDEAMEVQANAHPLTELKDANALADAAWARLLASFGCKEDELAYLRLQGKERQAVVVVDAQSGQFLRILDLKPSFKVLAPVAPTGKRESPEPPTGLLKTSPVSGPGQGVGTTG